MKNVGEALSSHASALDSAIASMAKSAIEADSYSKDLAIERTRKVLKFPPTNLEQHIMYTIPGKDGTPEVRICKFSIQVPTFIFVDNKPFIFTKYVIKATFEASIAKHTGVNSTTDIGVSATPNFLGIPQVGFDIHEKLTVDHSSDEKQSNSMDVEVEMGQGETSFGYLEIVKAFVRGVNKIVDEVMNQGFNNPKALTDDEAKELSEKGNIPIVDASGSVDGKETETESEGQGGGQQAQPAQG